jgi:hypothetical protein
VIQVSAECPRDVLDQQRDQVPSLQDQPLRHRKDLILWRNSSVINSLVDPGGGGGVWRLESWNQYHTPPFVKKFCH